MAKSWEEKYNDIEQEFRESRLKHNALERDYLKEINKNAKLRSENLKLEEKLEFTTHQLREANRRSE